VTLAEAIAGEPDLLLKMDAEGAEYETLPITDVSMCAAVVLEVHDLDEAEYRVRLAAIMERLEPDFVLVHIHGNSCCPALPLPRVLQGAGDGLPRVLEFTFVNRRLHRAPLELDDGTFPVPGLDATNVEDVPDLRLGWVNRY
ncbi:MAG: hypothetical protein ACR2J8_07045, partial [Thermomicrobiales bacterium]